MTSDKQSTAGPDIEDGEDAVLTYCAAQATTDLGNGRRFRRRHGDLADDGEMKAIKVAQIGWHVFDGARWAEDQDDSKVRPLAHDAAEAIMHETRLIEGTPDEVAIIEGAESARQMLAEMEETPETKDQRKQLTNLIARGEEALKAIQGRRKSRAAFSLKTQGSSPLTNMLGEAAPYLARTVDDLNQQRMHVNCQSGTVRFWAKEDEAGNRHWRADLWPHDSRDMITKIASAQWYPSYERHRLQGAVPTVAPPETYMLDMPVFDRFFQTVIPHPEMRQYLQRFFGYCLLGLTTEQILLFFYGAGRNGKSTFMDAITRVMGDYAVALAIESLSGDRTRSGAEATPDLARLPGARLVAASEPEAGARLKEALIKMLTGGERFPVRRLHKDFFEIDPQFKMVISGNHKPIITDDSDGTWRRLKLVPWEIQIDKKAVDVTLPDKLRQEADAIFMWLVEGALDYLTYGLEEPDIITKASTEYRNESDSVEAFILEGCIVTGNDMDFNASAVITRAYQAWCTAQGQFGFKDTTFAKRFAGKAGRPYVDGDGIMQQFRKAKTGGATVYRGIQLKPETEALINQRGGDE